jgi:hypothetical protein
MIPAAHTRQSQTAAPVPWRALALLAMTVLFPVAAPAADPAPTGQQLYQSLCADCHGLQGEGVEGAYDDPLTGGRSLPELTKYINDTMPQDEAEKCVGDEAKRVAGYIFDTFYSEADRARHKPPRIELAHLTVRQYLNTAADLVGSFSGEGTWGDQRGLKGTYYNARNLRGDKKVIERVDPQVEFAFGGESPDPAKIGKDEFSIQWQGGVLAEETGEYEFCLKADNAARLWVNDLQKPLIDAWVKSGDDLDHVASIWLVGGRVVPLRLEYSKFKSETATVGLYWQPPHRVRGVIPERNLSPNWFPPVLVVNTPFPPDDSSVGYERGSSVSAAWDQSTTEAALEIAARIAENLSALANCKDDAPDRAQRVKEFCERFVERAFRRPLTDEQKEFFVDRRFADGEALEASVKKVVLLALKSPRFLYLGLHDGTPDDYEVASRLSFGLWDTLPDPPLLQAAAQGQLRTPEQVAAQAERMLANPRTRAKLRYFFSKWLPVERAYDVSKDQQLFPEFDRQVASDSFASLDLFLDDVAWSPAADFRQLLLADWLFVNPRLAQFYGIDAPAGGGFHKVSCDPAKQAGILTHPNLMLGLAYHKSSSPIHRGVFLVRGVLGRALKPPPIAVAPADEGTNPDLTTRERVSLQTQSEACQNCHALINPLGFTLENYDAVGRFRTVERDKPIDATGFYRTLTGEEVQFHGARELAEFLAASDEVHRSFVEQLFHQIVKQPVSAYGDDRLEALKTAFVASEFNMQKLLVEILKATAQQAP